MSQLKKLIKDLCPDGVVYKTIQETVGVNRGKRLVKNQLSNDGEYEVYHGSKDSILGKYNQYNAPANTTIVVNTGGIGGVKFLDKPFWCSDGSFWLGQSNEIHSKYLYYCLSGYEDYFYSQKRIGGVPTIDRNVVETFKIPIPPLEVQNEIVRILDTFTSHAAELQAELQARKEQYEYYRNKLLSFDKNNVDVRWIKIGEFCKILRGKRLTTKELDTNGKFPVFHGGIKPIGFYPHSNRAANSTMIINVGASAGTVGFCKTAFWSSDGCFCFTHNKIVIQKYLFYVLQSMEISLKSKVRIAGIPTLDNKNIERLVIPVISLSEQQRIISILDKFETLVNDLTEGIPAEIAAVQEQYEYYRNKLLSFPKLEA